MRLKKLKWGVSLFTLFMLISGCVPEVKVFVPKAKISKSNISISNVKVVNHQIIVTGVNLKDVNSFSLKDGGNVVNLNIESKSATQIIGNTMNDVAFAAGKMFDLILSDANAAATFSVNFSLCNSDLNGAGFDCNLPVQHNDVLSYDQVSEKWVPRAMNGLTYRGAWDATAGAPTAISEGDYYIVSVANGVSVPPYTVGDWIVWNGSTYDKIDNSVVVRAEGDYNLTQMGDVNTTGVVANNVLKYNGAQWVPGAITFTETDPNVTAFAKAALPTCGAGEVLKSNGTILTCVTDVSGAGAFTGTGNRVVATDAGGALAVTAISDTILGYLSGATGNIQTQLDAKATSASIVNWAVTGAQTIDPTRLNLTVANAGKAVITDGSGFVTVSAVTSTQLGYLSGATSNIQTQLGTKLSAETDPNVSPFAKTTIPVCLTGEVLTSVAGTAFSCVADTAGAAAYSGGNNFVVVTGAAGALTDSTISTTKLGYLSGVTSDIQTQLGTKQATLSKTSLPEVSTIKIYGANATNYVELSAATLTANRSLIFPNSNGSSGDVLTTNGSGTLSWGTPAATGATSVFTRTGAVVAANGDYTASQVTNVAAGDIAAVTTQAAINELDTEKQSTSGLSAAVRAVTLTAIDLTAGVVSAVDTVMGAIGKLQGTITTLTSTTGNKLSKNSADSITATITVSGAGDIVLPAGDPPTANSASSKAYVDKFWAINGSSNLYYTTGKVGVGTNAPGELFEVNGNVKVGSQATRATASSRGQLAQGSTYITTDNASTTIDWNNGNLQELATFTCNGIKTITMSNLKDGAAYTLLLSGTAAHSGTCNFVSSGFIFKTPGGNAQPLNGKDVLYTFAVINTTVVFTMMDALD